MLSLLLLSLAGLTPHQFKSQPVFAAPDITSVRAEALVGVDGLRNPLQPTLDSSSTLTSSPIGADGSTLLAGSADGAPAMDQNADDSDGCAPNGNSSYEVTLGGAQIPPDVLTFTIPYTCPDGTQVMRTVKHTVFYRSGTRRWTYQQSSSQPGVVCPPLVTVVPFTEVSSETWEYDNTPVCPNSCCLLVSTTSRLEYSIKLTPGPDLVTYAEITCPNGNPGVQTTTTRQWFMKSRWVTTETYVSTCPGVNCPPATTAGNWTPILWKSTTTVTTDCGSGGQI